MKKTLMVLSAAALLAAPVMAANTLTVPGGTPGQGLNGTSYLLSINVDPAAANSVFVQSDHPTDETHLLIRFHLKFDALQAPPTGAGRNFRLLNIGDDSALLTPHKILFLQRQGVGAHNWRLLAWTYTDGGIYEFVGGFFLGNYAGVNERQIECEWTQATAGANGSFGCNRTDTPGTQFFLRTNIDDGNFQGDYVQVGLFDFDNFPGAAAASALKFDEYQSFR
jgi:hypothetical protein